MIDLKPLAEIFRSARSVLLVSHAKPDGDALGSTFGMREVLRSLNKRCDVLLNGELPSRYAGFCTGGVTDFTPGDLNRYEVIASFDCATRERLSLPDGITDRQFEGKCWVNLDHHSGNNLRTGRDFVDRTASSASCLASELSELLTGEIGAKAAGFFLAGMMTDTGCFRFTNTEPRTLRQAAKMLEQGADLEKISNAVFFSKPVNQAQFEAEFMTTALRFAFNGQVAYANISDKLLAKHRFHLREDEGLIDKLRELEGVVIAMLIHRCKDGEYKISMRSKDASRPVIEVARRFAGGGHAMAAGCTIQADSPETAGKIILTAMEDLFK